MSNYIDMTNEEIWEMLKPKMEKNGLEQYGATFPAVVNVNGNAEWTTYSIYFKEAVHNAIALAYKVGYLRAMKGRPFKIGEKKQKGHWEWIKPDEIVHDGTKVRYARKVGPSGNSIWANWKIGYEGKVTSKEDWNSGSSFWVNHYCFDSSRDCFQKWVEDDE